MGATGDEQALRDLLIYLDEIGYGDTYLRPADVAASARGEGVATAPGPPARPTSSRGPLANDALTAPSAPAPTPATAPTPSSPSGRSDERPAAPPARPPSQRPSHPAAPGSLFDAITGALGVGGAPPKPKAAAVPETVDGRATALAELSSEAAGCERCRLSRTRQHVVFGSGNPNADLMFIGEGPGADEDRQGLPFVGRAGELLTKIIEAIDLTRDQVYIANVVKCRPPGNRDPQGDEVAACRGYLERQIDLVAPKVIVALGRVAAQTVLGNNMPLGRMRGRWHSVRGVDTMVTYHPAALLRNPAWKRPTWEDMQQVRDRLQSD